MKKRATFNSYVCTTIHYPLYYKLLPLEKTLDPDKPKFNQCTSNKKEMACSRK